MNCNQYACTRILQNFADELKFNIKERLLKPHIWNICLPVDYYKRDSIYVKESIESIDDMLVEVHTITININKFYDIYTTLYADYPYQDEPKHIFLCPDDLKFTCNVTEIPNTKFDVCIEDIHIHYTPSINKSFLIDDRSLNR